MLPPEFDQTVMSLKVGQYTKTPVKTSLGYYIIKLEGLTPEKQLTFEEAKPKIQQQLPLDKKQKVFNDYVAELQAKAKIVNNLAKESPQQGLPQQGSSSSQLPAGHPPINQGQPGGK